MYVCMYIYITFINNTYCGNRFSLDGHLSTSKFLINVRTLHYTNNRAKMLILKIKHVINQSNYP